MPFDRKEELLSSKYEEVSPRDFYRYIFPEGSFERLGCLEDNKSNGLALTITTDKDGTNHGKHTVITDGLEQLEDLLKEEFVITSPISYCGRSRRAENARWIYALTLDIDYVDYDGLRYLLHYADVGFIPTPTFCVNSGQGIHLYFVFDEPLPMYKPFQKELKKLKEGLIEKCWNENTSTRLEAREALGVVQGFRMVGSRCKAFEDKRLTAYKIGDRVSLDYLNSFVVDDYKATNFKYESRMSLEEAKEKYPEWYQRVIVEGKPAGRWYVKRDLYDWWKRQLETSAVVIGHRYFCCLCLCVFGNKCGIEEDEIVRDLAYFQKRFDALSLDGKEPFTLEEAMKTLTAFDDSYTRYPRDTMSRISGIPMKANKRNYRKQPDHLKIARFIRDMNQEAKGTVWRNLEGRPTKKELVRECLEECPTASALKVVEMAEKKTHRAYLAAHPEAKALEVEKAVREKPWSNFLITRQTATKWIKVIKEESLTD